MFGSLGSADSGGKKNGAATMENMVVPQTIK